jgi:hypothetical protein
MTFIYIECEDCSHCIDFHNPTDDMPSDLQIAQEQIRATIGQWLIEANLKPNKHEKTRII